MPPASSAYAYFVAVQLGLVSSTCICLMINGFVGFQLYEDGTTLSVWLLRICSMTMFIISFAVSLLTFKGWAGLGPENTVGLFVVVYIFSAIFLAVYVVMQLLLVIGTLQERWPLGHIAFGILAFVIAQVILYVFSGTICEGVQHYLDALFFSTLLNLLAVMMVYKVCLFTWKEGRAYADTLCSTGTPSRKKTSSSLSAHGKAIGKSRSPCCLKTTGETLCTRTATTPGASTTSNLCIEGRLTVAIDVL